MQVNFETLKSAVFGAQRIKVENDALTLNRFTDKQQSFIDLNPDEVRLMKEKGQTTAGICFDFHTDSQNLKISVNSYIKTAQTLCYVDVLVNGEIVAHDGYNENECKSFTIKTSLGKGEKRVTIYMPNLFGAKVTEFELDDGATFVPYEEQNKFLFHGDSITQGYSAEYPSKSYANIISRTLNAHCVNQAIGGAVFNADLIDDVGFTPDKIFVAYGTNDWSKHKDFTNNSLAFFAKLKEVYKDSKIYVITPIWRGNIKEKTKTAQCSFKKMRSIIEKNALIYGLTVVDGDKLVPHDPKFFMQDVLHPNDEGFKHYAQNLCRIIKD